MPRAFRSDDESAQNRPRLTRSADARHEEAVGLAGAIDLDIVYSVVVAVNDRKFVWEFTASEFRGSR
jgi:GTP-binding protein HflX